MFRQIRKVISVFILAAFITTSVTSPSYAQSTQEAIVPRLPMPGVRVHLSPEFAPSQLQGITIHPQNALQFDFLIHRGDQVLEGDQKKQEYKKLIKYFLASLTIPDEDQWVNLSPYENNRIIKDDFGKTEMGRDLLAEDYMLKQITSSLIYPEDGLGKKFWDRVYERAWNEYHTTNIPVNTFNKVWIVPDQAIVYESGNTAYILKSHLKVMLEEDYLSLQKHSGISPGAVTHTIASQVIREIILPELEKEVNEGKNFASLRQMYSGMVLATWYKKALKESLLGKIYADKAKVKGVDQDPQNNGEIYRRYLKAFKKGVFNYIKEDIDKYTNEAIPRKYFSGGFDRAMAGRKNDVEIIRDLTMLPKTTIQNLSGTFNATGEDEVTINLLGTVDQAMLMFTDHGYYWEGQLRDAYTSIMLGDQRNKIRAKQILDSADLNLSQRTEMPYIDRVRLVRRLENLWRLFREKFPSSVLDRMMMPVARDISIGEFERTRDRIDQFLRRDGVHATRLLRWVIGQNNFDLNSGPNREGTRNILEAGLLNKDQSWQVLVKVIKLGYRDTGSGISKRSIHLELKDNLGGAIDTTTLRAYRLIRRLEQLSLDNGPMIEKIFRKASNNFVFEGPEVDLLGQEFFYGQYSIKFKGYMLPEARRILLASIDNTYKIVLPGQRINPAMLTGKRITAGTVGKETKDAAMWSDLGRALGRELDKVPNLINSPKNRRDRVEARLILNKVERKMKTVSKLERFLLNRRIQRLKILYYNKVVNNTTPKEMGMAGYAQKLDFKTTVSPQALSEEDAWAVRILAGEYLKSIIFLQEYFEYYLSVSPDGEESSFKRLENVMLVINFFLRRDIRKFNNTGKPEGLLTNALSGYFPLTNGKSYTDLDILNTLNPLSLGKDLVKSPGMRDLRDETLRTIHITTLFLESLLNRDRIYKTTFEDGSGRKIALDPRNIDPIWHPDTAMMALPVGKGISQSQAGFQKGGIDFNSANFAMIIKRDGNGVPLPLAQQDMSQLSHIQGFEPDIIEIRPAINVPILSELRRKLESSST